MNCTTTERLISAYCDNELAPVVRSELSRHLAGCGRCAQAVAELQRLSRLVARLPNPTPPADLWRRIERALDQPTTKFVVCVVSPFSARAKTAKQTRRAVGFAVVVITVSVIVAGGFLLTSLDLRQAEHHWVAADFDRYLNRFHQDAEGAQQVLMANYKGRRMDIRDATALVHYEPVAATQVPTGYAVESVNVLEMHCCQCTQVIWQRHTGGHLAIFEHEMEQPAWFGDRPSIAARCHGKAVRIVEMNERLAATWASGRRQLTLVGVRDIKELLRLVLHFDDTS